MRNIIRLVSVVPYSSSDPIILSRQPASFPRSGLDPLHECGKSPENEQKTEEYSNDHLDVVPRSSEQHCW